jgi:single-stranded DNA-specific DHH superfamily exonuclease
MTEKPKSGKQTLGQLNRKNIQERIEELLPYYCSKTDDIDELAHYISYDFHMNPHTIRYFYLPMFITVGRLQDVNGHITCIATEDGLSEKNLQEELKEENEQRSKLDKSPLTLEEWKKKRTQRFKPIQS